MLGRASHGAPWIFRSVNAQLGEGIAGHRSRARSCVILFLRISTPCTLFTARTSGVRIARKHLGWYCEQLLTDSAQIRRSLMAAVTTSAQFVQAGSCLRDWVEGAA